MDKNLESNEYSALFSGDSWVTNILNENHTELNFFEGFFHEILVRETNLWAQQKAAVKPDQNESGTFF